MPIRHAASTTASTVFALLACLTVLATLHFARELLIPFALAILFTFILAPLVNRLERLRLGRVLPVMLVVTLAFVIIALVTIVVFTQGINLADQIPRYADNIKEKIKFVTPGRDSVFGKLNRAKDKVNQSIEKAAEEVAVEDASNHGEPSPPQTVPESAPAEPVPVQVTAAEQSPLDMVRSAGPALKVIGNGAVVTVLVIFMLLERRNLRDRVIVLAGQGRLNITTVALEETGRRVSRYLLMQLLVNFLYGLPVGLGLWMIGVPNSFLWGLVAMMLRFIPYVGPWIGATGPVLLSLAVFDDWTRPLMVVGLFVVLELVVNNALEPFLYGSQAGVSPLALLAATVFWTWVWGSVGLILAVPMTVCVVVITRHVPHLGFINALLTDQPVLTDDARFQLRLLSLDFDEAFEIAEDNCHEHSLVDTYDRLVLPALRQAEMDFHDGTIDDERVHAIRRGVEVLIMELSECVENGSEAYSRNHDQERSVMCVPARDEADELAARMLGQLLRQSGISAEVFAAGQLTSEVTDRLWKRAPRAVFVSAMPPSAISQARHIAARVVDRLPDVPVVVGVWEAQHKDRTIRRMPPSETVRLVSTLAQAVQELTACCSTPRELSHLT